MSTAWADSIAPRLAHADARLAAELGAPTRAEHLPRVVSLLRRVLEWNARLDLTAARSADELVDLYLADAWVLAAYGDPAAAWIDVGSGGGAPGLVLAALQPSSRVTLVEPKTKRVAFLRTAAAAVGLGVTVVRARSDACADGSAEVAVARATLPPPAWLREGARLARRGVWVLLAREAPPELAGWRVDRDLGYEWPLTAVERRAVYYVPTR